VQFGKKIREFGNVQEKLTDMIVRHYVTESIVYMLASNMDRGIQDYQLEAAIGKVVASENAWHVCDEAIQLHGGMGFMKECGLERVLRDLRIFRIFEGANDVMRLFVALTGMKSGAAHLTQLVKDIKAGGFSTMFQEIKRRATGSIGGDVATHVHSSLSDNASTVNNAIKEFGGTVETLLTRHRAKIIDRQYEVIRVANAAIDIYSMVAVLSRCSYALEKGIDSSPHEKQIVELFIRQASKRALANLTQAATPSETEMKIIKGLSEEVCNNEAMVQSHPINI